MRQIFKYCTLKEQISLSKVCREFYEIIQDLWRCRYRTLYYNLYDYEFKHNLSPQELQDFCIIQGAATNHLTFNTIFYLPLIQKYLINSSGNLMQKAKIFMNQNLCRNIMHFGNLEILEIHGKFLMDFTIKEVARYCPQLKVFRLIDADSRWLRGRHFHLLRNLSELNLKDCENFQRRNLKKFALCKSLQNLNIVESKSLLNAPFLSKLCDNLINLNTLRLSALLNEQLLIRILQLPNLKTLQFYWLKEWPEFVNQLFELLLSQKSDSLRSLRFVTERIFVDNESHESLRSYNYALMREKVGAVAGSRQWPQFEGILPQFPNLEQIVCDFCPIFKTAELLRLPLLSPSLKCIHLIGCRQPPAEESEFREVFQKRHPKCQLRIEGLINEAAAKVCIVRCFY